MNNPVQGVLDPAARQVLDLMAASGAPTLDQLPPEQAREAARAGFAALQSPPTAVGQIRNLEYEGPTGRRALRLYRPRDAAEQVPLPACLYFHGGGFVIGDLDLYDNVCRELCRASGCAILSVDYRLAPEARFPAAVEDCWAATRWVAAHAHELGLDPSRLAVAGDSAGGNLAAVIALMARDEGAPALRHQLLIYPVTDLRGDTESYKANGEGYFLTSTLMQWFKNHYIGEDSATLRDWRASPLLAASHSGLPPATVLVCGFDPLRDEGLSYADKLRSSGVAVELLSIPDQIHGYICMDAAVPAARTTLERLGKILAGALR